MATEVVVDIREKAYGAIGRQPGAQILHNIAFSLEPGVFAALVGPSGCGKTTLLNLIAGLDGEYDGSVTLTPNAQGAAPRLGYVFQNPRLLPWRTVRQNLELVMPDGYDPKSIDQILDAVGLNGFADAFPNRLSVGMSRRVAIARAFAVSPDLLLMDEPFVSLDEENADRMRDLLLNLWRNYPTTVLFVTHDLREALFLAQKVILFSRPPTTILNQLKLPDNLQGDPAASETLRQQILMNYKDSAR